MSSRVVVAQVKPGSKKGPLIEVGPEGVLLVYVPERAVDGKANLAVQALLATYLGVPKSSVRLLSGARSKHKRFDVPHCEK
ncbi:MAG: DUF167 domain-containing protein [Mycobacteriaceae bacterium]